AGGGALFRFDDYVPMYGRLLIWWLRLFMRFLSMTGGAFMFCTHAAFDAVGGFNERLYGGEDAAMSWALKREGRFVVLWGLVSTSGSRARGMGGLQMVGALLRMAFFPRLLTRRAAVGKVWYESNRESDEVAPSSLGIKLSNAILFVVMVLIILGPIWMLPWPERYF